MHCREFRENLQGFRHLSLPIVTTAFSGGFAVFAMDHPRVLAAFLFVLPLLASDGPGFVWLSPLLYRIPLLGSFSNTLVGRYSRKLTALLLVKQNLPLPEVLRLAAEGVSDPYLRRGRRRPPSKWQTAADYPIPCNANAPFRPALFRSSPGVKNRLLCRRLFSAHELYANRAESQTTSFMAIAVPLVFFSDHSFRRVDGYRHPHTCRYP